MALLGEIESRFGRHPVGDCDAVDERPRALHRLARRVLDGVQLHGQVFRHLMRERPWNVFFAAFSAPHCIGHHFWRFMDPTHPQHPKTDPLGLAGTIEQVYRAIDREIGEMLTLAGGTTRCMVVAAHGMGPIYHASWNLPEILELLGHGRRPLAGPLTAQRSASGTGEPLADLEAHPAGGAPVPDQGDAPPITAGAAAVPLVCGGPGLEGMSRVCDPEQRLGRSDPHQREGARPERDGGAGDEYRRVCQDIADALYELSDPVSNRPVVQQVTLTHDEFRGPFLNQLPDLTVLWNQGFPWDSLHSPRFGTLRLRRQDGRSGSHTPHGFAILAGQGVPAGVELTGRSIYDIAPTVLDAAGVPIPPDLDGRPLRRILAETPN